MNHFFALRRVDIVDLLGQLQGLFLLQPGLLGVDFFSCFDAAFRKKLLRLATRLSARTVIAPIDSCHLTLLLKFCLKDSLFEREKILFSGGEAYGILCAFVPLCETLLWGGLPTAPHCGRKVNR